MVQPLRRRVFLDPVGDWAPYVMIIIAAPTGVVYEHQCAGLATELRTLEGYLVPIDGFVNDNEGRVDPTQLTAIFHDGGACQLDWVGAALPDDRMRALRSIVASLPFWLTAPEQSEKGQLRVDDSRAAELAEAWVPVTTADGPGVVVWSNCD